MALLLPTNDRPHTKLLLEHFDRHERLGVDFDGTLVDHDRSALIQQYILDHPEKDFHIVTFRSHGMQDRIERDLWSSSKDTGVDITLAAFTGIHNIQDGLYESHLALKGDPNYWAWKAVKCAQLSCTIMIDDMAEQIYKECISRGIEIVSPDDFDFED